MAQPSASTRWRNAAITNAGAKDPELLWTWYDWRRGLIAGAKPNPAHEALARLEQRVPRFTLITQNIDGLHQRAGSRNLLEVHGNIWTLRCTQCEREWPDSSVPINIPPHCECGGLARPAVVWFGEGVPSGVWNAAEQAAISCEVFLVVGTSAIVFPAAGLVGLAKESGAKLVEVNVEPTPMSGIVDCALTGPAGEILPKLVP
jgi:NAD-dependent deacetylase